MASSLSVEELASRIDLAVRDFALLDVREQWQYVTDHIPRASTVPLGDLEARIVELVPADAPIVVYSGQDNRARIASDRLAQLGYRQVRCLGGGFDAWRAAGKECEHGWGTQGREYGEKIAHTNDVPGITPEELMRRRQKGDAVVVLDVRTVGEYRENHLPGAYSTPLDRLPLEALDILKAVDLDKATVVANCAGRTRSIFGADLLRRLGIKQALALENGTMAWGMCGYGLEAGDDPRRDRTPSAESLRRAEKFAQDVSERAGVRAMSVEALLRMRDQRHLHYLIDVRQPEEYQQGHIPGAIACETCFVAPFAESIVGIPSAPIIMTCDGRARAILAGEMYRGMGYPNVYFLDGGTEAWRHAAQPLERGIRTVSPPPAYDQAQERVRSLSLEECRTYLARPAAAVIDVRGIAWYAMGHIQGAKWLSRSYLDRCAGALLPDRRQPLVLVCDDGVRSTLAAMQLQQQGYENAAVLRGGLEVWRTAGLPLREGLDGTGISLAQAKRDVMPLYMRGILMRTEDDMREFLEDEEALGDKYKEKS